MILNHFWIIVLLVLLLFGILVWVHCSIAVRKIDMILENLQIERERIIVNETGFWLKIKKGMAPYWQAYRVEGNPGFPDVDYALGYQRQGKIELKYIPEAPKRPTTKIKIPHFNPSQKLFIRQRGPFASDIWLLVGVGKETFLFDWRSALKIEEWTLDEWRRLATIYFDGKIDYQKLYDVLKKG